MSLFNRRFTPAYDILQAKKRAGAPPFVEIDKTRLLPAGGTQNQVLSKGATAPEWVDGVPSARLLPVGGTQNQVLSKGATAPEWATPKTTAFSIFNGF